MRKVFEHPASHEVGHCESILQSHGIRTLIRNQNVSSVVGGPFTSVYPELWVIDDDCYEPAIRILRDYRPVETEAEPAADWICRGCRETVPGTFDCCWSCGELKEATAQCSQPKPDLPPATYDFLLFDLDGTISNNLEGIARSINHALVHFGYPEQPVHALRSCVGPPIQENFRQLTGVHSEKKLGAMVDKYRERFSEVGLFENQLYVGMPETLRQLAVTKRLGVCTSKRRDFALRILQRFGLEACFELIDGGDVGITKADQVTALRESGVLPERTIMIGDRASDLDAAHRNGYDSAGVLWGFGPQEELVAEQPAFLFRATKELLRLE